MRNVLLVGGGHAHVYVLKQLQHRRWPDTRVTLISPNLYQYYSGMFAGYVEGCYELDEICFDLVHLCEAANINFLEDSVDRVDPGRREIVTSNGTRMKYDLISFNIGSRISNTSIPGVQAAATLIKPNYLIPAVTASLLMKERLIVVGGGASGIEMSLSLQARRKGLGFEHPVVLVSSGQLMEYAGNRISWKIKRIAQNKGIHIIPNDSVISVNDNELNLKSGKQMSFDALLWLTGPAASPLFRDNGVPTDDKGFMLVNENLQSVAYENMFGAGDCVTLKSHPSLHKAGVYAVREAPVLWTNLENFMAGRRLKKYRPQLQYLSILTTGEGEAMLLYRGMSFHGKWCWRLKRRIDRSFVRRYR